VAEFNKSAGTAHTTNQMKKLILNITSMRKFGLVALTALASTAFFACSSDDPDPNDGDDSTGGDGQEQVDPSATVHGTMTAGRLSGFVVDPSGNPLTGVTVVSGTHSAVTNDAGAFTLSEIDVNDNRSIVKFSKDGYFTVTRSMNFTTDEIWNVTLVRKGSTSYTANTSFESTVAASLNADGMKVNLSANGMKNRVTNEPFTGKVVADMVYLNPNNEHFADLMPGGDLSAVRADGTDAQLVSYGMTAVNLTDENGNELQLADGTPATLTFPIPEGMKENPHPTIPLWSFDETTGKWVEEGEARLENGVYVGTVTHFSWVNLDWPAEQATIKGTVVDEAGDPVPYQRVKVGQITIRTDAAGHFTQAVPAGEAFDITVKSEWYADYTPEVTVHVSALEPLSEKNVQLTLPKLYKVTGRLLQGGKPAIGYLWLTVAGKDGVRTVTDANGSFMLQIPVNYTGDAMLNILAGTKATRDLSLGKEDIDLGDIELGTPDTPAGDGKTYTPTESKEYLEQTALQFLSMFKPEDQRAIIELANYFTDTYGNLDAPTEWNLDDEDVPGYPEYYTPRKVMNALRQVVVGRDLSAMSRVADDVYDFNRFAGIYEPGANAWVKTGDSKDIVFKFSGKTGLQCTLTASGTGGEWIVNANGYEVRTPETVTLKLVEGSTTHMAANVRSNVNEKAHTSAISTNVVVANIECTTAINGTDTRITQNAQIKVSGKTVVTNTASIDGKKLCDRANWERIINEEDGSELESVLSKANAEADVLGRLQAKAEVTAFAEIAEALDGYYDYDEFDSKDAAKAACDADCHTLNSNVITSVYYNTSTRQAQLWFTPELYEEDGWDWWEWMVVPTLKFLSDGSTYGFEDYFANSRFIAVENQWETLINSYKNLWK